MTDIAPGTTFNVATAPNRNSLHWVMETVTWGELLSWMEAPARRKACGNYMLGVLDKTSVVHRKGGMPCIDFHRTKLAVRSRSAITLDVDHPEEGFVEHAQQVLPHAAIIHTTYSSSPEYPRYRVIVPLDRSVAPDEYHTAASTLMQQLGEKAFDPGSVQAERYMFKPSEQEPGFFRYWVLPGGPAQAEALLAEFQSDLSDLPAPKPHKNKRDPFAIEGTIGAFNRAYEDFAELIEEYELPYVPAGADRWQLAGATAAAGMGVVQDGLVYSHHANDPAYGQTCSAFDLARLHLFGHLDEDKPANTPVNRLPSNAAMVEVATQDLRVVRELVGLDFDAEMEDTAEAIEKGSWKLSLQLDAKTGEPRDTIHNWDLIAEHDPAFQAVFFNELSMAIEIDRDLPWRTLDTGETFRAGDRSQMALHIEREYRIRPGRAYLDDLINDRALPRRRNPVREYLQTLVWDGVPRVETCLPGTDDTPYNRLVARKAMAAAVARMMEPGIKWDHIVILFGKEGLGKSHWIDTMARGYSANLGRIGDKDTLITMQRSWLMTADEGNSLKKADWDAQKEFLTRTADIFRMPYEREAGVHPRHCVIWGTTNDEVFLRRQEGNRRFLIVRAERPVDYALLTDEYVDQVWAEAVHLYRAGEKLFLEDEQSEMAAAAREQFTEEDALGGIITEYLNTLVPADWDTMTPEARQMWLQNRNDGFSEGTEPITQVCSVQIWVEALGRRYGDHRRVDLLEINSALKTIPGWELRPGRRRVPGYGPQVVFVRKPDVAAALGDLL